MDYGECLEFAEEKHSGQKRGTGEDYITHPVAVSNILRNKRLGLEYQCAGLFHDLLEDTDATYGQIKSLSNKNVADAVVLVTKEKGYSPDDYIARIGKNKIAHMVKLADRFHNLKTSFGMDIDFRKRYVKDTEDHYLGLARGTLFEKDIAEALEAVRKTL